MPLVDFEANDSVAIAESVQSQPNAVSAPRVRKFFPETWIWECRDARFVIRLFRVNVQQGDW